MGALKRGPGIPLRTMEKKYKRRSERKKKSPLVENHQENEEVGPAKRFRVFNQEQIVQWKISGSRLKP